MHAHVGSRPIPWLPRTDVSRCHACRASAPLLLRPHMVTCMIHCVRCYPICCLSALARRGTSPSHTYQRLLGLPVLQALAVQHPHLLFYATMAAAVLLTVLVLHMCLARGSSITHSLQSLPRVLGLSADARSFPSGIVTYISATVAGGVLLLLRALYAVLTALLLVWSCGAAVCTAFMQLVAWLAWQVISGVCCACVVGALVWRGERRGFCWVAVMCWAAVIARSM